MQESKKSYLNVALRIVRYIKNDHGLGIFLDSGSLLIVIQIGLVV